MSKVLVDRELLRDCSAELSDWRMSFPNADSGMTDRLVGEIDAILAQPAEAEGVRDYLTEFAEGEVEAKTAIEELQDALSAVTAERDRLRKANASRSDKLNEAQSIIDQLRAEVEGLREAFGECIQSLHDEMLQSYGGQKPDDMHPVTRRNYDRDMAEIAEYRAAMAAKEA